MNNRENSYYDLLMDLNKDFIYDIVNTYYTDELQSQILTYFRIFFFYYLVTYYVYKPELNIQEIKNVFFNWLDNSFAHKEKNKIIKVFTEQYNYLFKIFFVDKNIYFHAYFNNLIKYFFPLPYEINFYSSVITYRSNVKNFYKKNNIDYYENYNNFDTIKNGFNPQEIDIHIPIKFFNYDIFKNLDVVYLVGKSNKLYIVNSEKKVLFIRNINIKSNYSKYVKKFFKHKSFEEIFPLWEKCDDCNFDFSDSIYISVCKKYELKNLFKVFEKYELSTNKYNFLFHNAHKEYIKNYSDLLTNSTFFYLIPNTKSRYFKNEPRACVVFKINSNIKNLLDLSMCITTNNNFTLQYLNLDEKYKKWICYDPKKVLEYYTKNKISEKFDTNFKCINKDINEIKKRIYCDIEHYAGRRKLQEIIFKTRKYKYNRIYFNADINITNLSSYELYHPKSQPVNANWDFDKYILKDIGSNGFFFVDYGDAIDGGEIMLTNPQKYLNIETNSNKPCYDTLAFDDKNLEKILKF